MNVIFFGTPQFAVPTLEKLLNHPKFKVLAVVSQPDKRRGRGTELTPSPVKQVALSHNLPVWQPQRIKKDTETLTLLKQAGADVFVVVAYGQILSQEILDMPPLGCVNVHGSILPQYRGAAPIQWCLYHGETITGITTMQMDAGMDIGPMLLKYETPVDLFENAHQLAETLSESGANLLIETLLKLEAGEVQAIPQENSQATYAPLIKKEDYRLNWEKPALALHNQVRGFYPNCITTFHGQSLKILVTAPLSSHSHFDLPASLQSLLEYLPEMAGQPGEVVYIAKGFGPIIQAGSDYLLLQEVQLAGKRPQSGWDFANGMRLSVSEVLGNQL